MTAIDKTQHLLRVELPMGLIVPNPSNPNKMTDRAFDLLVDNLEKTGWTDPILCTPVDDATREKIVAIVEEFGPGTPQVIDQMQEDDLKVRIVGGHHRYDAGQYIGFSEAPCTVILDGDFDEQAEQFQMVRMNVIRGKLDPQAFFKMYEQLADEYTDDVMQDMFGFAEEAEFQRLIQQTADTMPDEGMKKRFKEAAKEVKTIDGLAKLLNEMFSKYGDTLPHGYMVVDYGGERSLWLQVSGKTMQSLDLIGDICIENQRTMDDLIGGVVQLIAKGELKETLDQLIENSPKVVMPANMQVAPTKDHIDQVNSL